MPYVKVFLLCLVTLAASPAWGQSVSYRADQQRRSLASRAARADAIGQLAARIKGLSISADATIADLAAGSPKIEEAITAFLTGSADNGDAAYDDEGVCTLTMDIPMASLIVNLRTIYDRYYDGQDIPRSDLAGLAEENGLDVLTATGTGATDLPEMMLVDTAIGSVDSGEYLSAEAAEFWDAHCSVRGRMLAVAAARAAAVRRLAASVGNVAVDADTTVRDLVGEGDYQELLGGAQNIVLGQMDEAGLMNLAISLLLPTAKDTRVGYQDDKLSVEVEVEVTVRDVLMTIKAWLEAQDGDHLERIAQLEKIVVKTRERTLSAIGLGAPPENQIKGDPADVLAVVRLVAAAPRWIGDTHRTTGMAMIDEGLAENERRQRAFGVAELDAWIKLGEELAGLKIAGGAVVGDVLAQDPAMVAKSLAYMQGATLPEAGRTVMPDGAVEVVIEIELYPLWRMIVVNHIDRPSEAGAPGEADAPGESDEPGEVAEPNDTDRPSDIDRPGRIGPPIPRPPTPEE